MAETTSIEQLKRLACDAIDKNSAKLKKLNKNIYENPETNYKETECHRILTEFFKDYNFEVTPNWTLDTAFCAKYGKDEGPCVGVVCEYDALPEVGHACGHNLIAEAGAAAAIGM